VTFTSDPLFWAFISMFALAASSQIVGSKKLGRHPLFGFIVVAVFALGRVVLVLPSLPQPRLDIGAWHWVIGGLVFALGMVFSVPALAIKPFTVPDEKIELKTTWFYGVVRNPIYLAEVLWTLGWSILFRSVIGLLLVPFWWAGLLFITLIEEESLERELGQPYLEYKKRVRGRIIPGLPI
jgi:protein-S-isoprenylcysteine O-methyltransferase Ste14